MFISHRHADRAIADVLRDWIERWTQRSVRVYQSSSSKHSTRTGDRLTEALRRQLYESSVVLCPFTGHGPDWSWCMWECGLATHPLRDSTRVVILQFSGDVPSPFGDLVRVDVRDEQDILKFATDFLTDEDFVPDRRQPLTLLPAGDPIVDDAGKELYRSLRKVGPPEPGETWESWPVLILEFPLDLVDALDPNQDEDARVQGIEGLLMEDCNVVDGQRLARNMFGIIKFREPTPFADVYAEWRRQYPDSQAPWLNSVARQISLSARRRLPATDWVVVEGATAQLTIPVLCWTVREPAKGTIQFHMYFIPVKRVDPSAGGLVELGFIE